MPGSSNLRVEDKKVAARWHILNSPRRWRAKKMKKALVTGGLGFIGSHLVDKLLAEGWEVVVLDNLLTGRKSNLARHAGSSALKVVEGDIRNKGTVTKSMRGADAVFHLAAHALMRVSQSDPSADIDYNFQGTMNVLLSAAALEVPDFVFASTSALYGEALVVPTPEEYSGIQTSFYGAAKLAGEAFASALVQFVPMKFWAFRFGTVLGERCRRGAIWDFEHKLMKNPKELEILGDGKQTKDYLSVEDCVEGMMVGYQKSSGAVNIFNLGLTEKTTVDEVADIVIQEMGLRGVKRRYTGGSHGWKGDNPVVNLSYEKIRKLGWKPKTGAKDAVRHTARWTLAEIGWRPARE
jgi:UDP-glucose 4-epimerase